MRPIRINDQELITALRRMAPETGSLICMGCGYEHRCSVHGCAVLRAAAERLRALTAPPPNLPLTLEELREMDEPVWIEWCDSKSQDENEWALVKQEGEGCRTFNGFAALFEWYGHAWLAYRRKPEEGTR